MGVLLEAGADVNLKDQSNRTPLMIAMRGGFQKIEKLLLEKGPDGYTPC